MKNINQLKGEQLFMCLKRDASKEAKTVRPATSHITMKFQLPSISS